jgi:hypothetical protein
MEGINRALKNEPLNKAFRELLESVSDDDVPCIFISYQRADEIYANDVAEYIMSKQIDVYFDLEDNDLKFYMQANNPKGITSSIQKALVKSDYMIVVISPDTFKSPWIPFEVGYAYDKKGNNLKLLRHKGISKASLPSYLKVKEIINGTEGLNQFLNAMRKRRPIYESIIEKGESLKSFSAYYSNPLNKYLDNE